MLPFSREKSGFYFKPHLLTLLLSILPTHVASQPVVLWVVDLERLSKMPDLPGRAVGAPVRCRELDQMVYRGPFQLNSMTLCPGRSIPPSANPLLAEAQCRCGARSPGSGCEVHAQIVPGLISCSLPSSCLEMSWVCADRSSSVLLWQFSRCKEKDKKRRKILFLNKSKKKELRTG